MLSIKDGEIGHSYSTVFQRCIDGNVEWVELQDPYLRSRHQVHNVVRFCELLVKGSRRLKEIKIITRPSEEGTDTAGVSYINMECLNSLSGYLCVPMY